MRSIQTATHPVIAGQRANAVFAPREPNGRRWQAKPRHDDLVVLTDTGYQACVRAYSRGVGDRTALWMAATCHP